ncbi:MAG: phosphohydrolase, partial [Alicyclobacillus sp.]|nr:phosphohydrolase [Alicyclobacillus sp.]
RMALPLVWSSMMTYEKNEVARLCRMLAQLAYFTGQRPLALRLIEKAQLFFGQLEMWREWEQVQSVMDQWEATSLDAPAFALEPEDNPRLQQFARLLDALNAQELIHDSFSRLIDTRVFYLRAFTEHLGIRKAEQSALIYAARFMDIGLTSIEPDVVANPDRSAQARAQYELHPALSVDMLRLTGLSDDILAIISDHHEWVDGSGFPAGKRGAELSRLPQMLAIADDYASALVEEKLPHHLALCRCQELAGRKYEENLVNAFTAMFDAESRMCGGRAS